MADGVHQVGFAQAHPAIDEQGVIGIRRRLRHRQRAAWAKRLPEPTTKDSKVYLPLSLGKTFRTVAAPLLIFLGLLGVRMLSTSSFPAACFKQGNQGRIAGGHKLMVKVCFRFDIILFAHQIKRL